LKHAKLLPVKKFSKKYMESKLKIIIGWLYPDLMSTYGDRGNIICLKKRCEWRGIETVIKEIGLEEPVNSLEECDLLFMGGAQDRQQKIVAEDLKKNKGPIIKQMIAEGIPGLFICGAFQFLGHYYQPADGEKIYGLNIFDLYTVHPGKAKERCIGNIVIKVQNSKFILRQAQDDTEQSRSVKIPNYLVGFENHGGRTYLGQGVEPLGEVVTGYGNNGDLPATRQHLRSCGGKQVQAGDKTEGCVYQNAIGTYLHGPILPKNPHLADWLIKTALSKKYKNEVKLNQLDDTLEWQAHNFMITKILKK